MSRDRKRAQRGSTSKAMKIASVAAPLVLVAAVATQVGSITSAVERLGPDVGVNLAGSIVAEGSPTPTQSAATPDASAQALAAPKGAASVLPSRPAWVKRVGDAGSDVEHARHKNHTKTSRPSKSAASQRTRSTAPSARPIAVPTTGATQPAPTPTRTAAPAQTSTPTSAAPAPTTTASPAPTTTATHPGTPSGSATTTQSSSNVGSSSPAAAAAGGSSSALAAEVLRLTNVERAAAGCGALTANSKLAAAATGHSQDMAANNYFAHASQDGRTPFQRITNAGYTYRAAAENIAAGQRTPAEVVTAWMNSPGHRTNIVNCTYTELGVGVAVGGSYGFYWTQNFGRP